MDITNNHQYPYKFIHSDIFDLDIDFLKSFDFIYASPPCQQFSWSARQWVKKGYKFDPDLVEPTRKLLLKTGKPFMLENVIGAPLRKDLVLCGEMFGLRVIRHRIFELHGFKVSQPKHKPHKPPIDKSHSYYACVSGHGGNGYSFKLEDWQKAIGIDWITEKEHLTQAIPPKYIEYIGRSIIQR